MTCKCTGTKYEELVPHPYTGLPSCKKCGGHQTPNLDYWQRINEAEARVLRMKREVWESQFGRRR